MLESSIPNLARHVFLHPTARDVHPDWLAAADEQVSRLRAASTRWGEDEGFVQLIDELNTEPEFVMRWSAFAVSEKRRGTKRLVHPAFGELRFAFETLLVPDYDEQRLITWFATDDATNLAIAAIVNTAVPVSPAQLRIIG
jgi:hypothetical protein